MTYVRKYNKSTLSRWNRFLLLSNDTKIRCRFNITITTKSLNLKEITDKSQFRHDIILDLHSKGFTDIEISDYLNKNNVLTPTGKKYYYNLVSVTRKKLRMRDNRKTNFSYELGRLNFF